MNARDKFVDTVLATALASTAISSDATQTGSAIDISNVIAIALFLRCTVYTDGDISIQDVQFADDSSFTTNVVTITSDDILMKNDPSSSDSAISQTLLEATGIAKIRLENRAINSQKYMRVRTVSDNSADLTAEVIAILSKKVVPAIQA